MPLELWNLGVTSPPGHAPSLEPWDCSFLSEAPVVGFSFLRFGVGAFFVCLTYGGPRARDVSETFFQNFESRNN